MKTIKKPIDIKDINLQTEENCFYAVLCSKGEYIKYVLSPSDSLIKFALRINGNNIRFIPEEKKTEEFCILAAIHGASINLLPFQDENVTKICELISYITEVNENTKSRWKNLITDVRINGELTNLKNKVSSNLFEDIDEYNQYYVNLGYNIGTNIFGNIYVKDGNIITFNHYLQDYSGIQKYEFKFDDISLLFHDGVFDSVLANSMISKNPNMIMDLDDKYITSKLITTAIYKGLDVSNYDRLAKIDLKTVTKAGIRHATCDFFNKPINIPHDEIVRKLFYLNGMITDDMIKIMIDKCMEKAALPFECMTNAEEFKNLAERFININKKKASSGFSVIDPYKILLNLFNVFKTGASSEDLTEVVSFYPITFSACPNQEKVFEELGIDIIYKFFKDLVQNVPSYSRERILNYINFNKYETSLRVSMYRYARENNLGTISDYFKRHNLTKG